MYPVIQKNELILEHQFGFRRTHSTIEQAHRVADTIKNSLERKEYCPAVLLDISQAFNKVWHTGLLFKLKQNVPHTMYEVLRSYLTDRHLNYAESCSDLSPILAGVPQGSVLGPVLYF